MFYENLILNLNMYILLLQIDLITQRRGTKAYEGWRTHSGINPGIIPFGARQGCTSRIVFAREFIEGRHASINMSLSHYLSNCLKLSRYYAKVRDSPVTPGDQKHVTLRILAIVNSSSVEKKTTGSEMRFNR